MLKTFLLTVLLSAFSAVCEGWVLRAESQSQVLSSRCWRHEDGLPSDTVTSLLQTQDGFLWVGTADGLARFDGVGFDTILLPAERFSQPPGVTCLCEDEFHRLWIGTRDRGLFWMEHGVVHRFNDKLEKSDGTIASLADSAGQLWVGRSAGLFIVNLKTLQAETPSLGFTNELISSVHAARSGTIWITTPNGMSQYKNGHITPVNLDAENLGRTLEFIGLYEDRTGSLWAFGDTYLVNLSEGKRFNYFRTGDASSFRIWTLCEGRSGQLWIGTSGQGLFAFSEGKFRPLALRENRLPSDVRAICEDQQGDLWLGTFGGGLIRLRVRQEKVFDSSAGLPDETASCIGVGSNGRLWAGFPGGGLYAAAERRFERVGNQRLVSCLCLETNGAAWMGTRGDGLFRVFKGENIHFGTENGLSSDNITALATAKDNSILIGTSTGAVHRMRANRLETLVLPEGSSAAPISALLGGATGNIYAGTSAGEIFRLEQGLLARVPAALTGAEIRGLQEDAGGRLWIATDGKGLACFEKNELTAWDTRNGLPNNNVASVLPETNGVVWMATGKGIYRLENCIPTNHQAGSVVARLMVENEAAPNEMPGFPMAVRSDDGQFWFALHGRVVAVDPRKIEINSAPSPVYIKQVLANDVELPLSLDSEPVRLPHSLVSLEIRFAALNLADPESIRLEHKLDGFDSGWVEGGSDRRVRYGRLPYGNYTFHVRARNADGLSSETQANLALVYPAPPWLSTGALVFYALAATGGVVLGVWGMSHRRLRFKLERLGRQQEMQKERMRIAQDMHDEVGSKLTKIAFLTDIMALRVKGAEVESLRSIAGTARDLLQSLDEIVWAVNPRNDSLEHVAAYLGHFATEYLQDTAVELELDLPAGLPECPLSAETRHNIFLAFEEALANALKHSGATKIHVSMGTNNGGFRLTVHDNGRGFTEGARARIGGGNGLANMRQRLRDVGGECEFDHPAMGGTTVLLRFPLSVREPNYL